MKVYESTTIVRAAPEPLWRAVLDHFQDDNAPLFYIDSTLKSWPSLADVKLVSKYGFRRKILKGQVVIADPPKHLSLSFSVLLPLFHTNEVWSLSIESKSDFSSTIVFSSNVKGWWALRHFRKVRTERQLQIDNFMHTLKSTIEVVKDVQSD
ncbi:hypothetical protein [Marinomonas balearica]|uniref:Polyketide cyclase/dehydrase/lipid transport protein n=1 Tax=Marinomonas balearica TaxID=491947 RepID=A0A4V6PTT7_9GAMM|nr:hypothetical protein [Marinomonas balearica]TDO96932.1 hypothetical protein DFP79_2703 [Marinomonas balearica]